MNSQEKKKRNEKSNNNKKAETRQKYRMFNKHEAKQKQKPKA